MIYNLDADDNRIAALLSMIERKAPLLMRAGGPIEREVVHTGTREARGAYMTDERKTQIRMLAATQKFCSFQIADQVGVRRSAVAKYLRTEKITVPDGRTVRGSRTVGLKPAA